MVWKRIQAAMGSRGHFLRMARCVAGLLFLCAVLNGCRNSSEETPGEVFEAFSQAWRGGDAEQLSRCISDHSKTYFKALQPWIVRGDDSSMRTLPLFDRYFALMIRMRLDSLEPSDWEAWEAAMEDGADPLLKDASFFAMIEEAFYKTSLGTVDSVAGATAGRLFRMGSPVGNSVHFVKENGWKIDLARFFRDSFEVKLKPYLTDDYRNRDRVWEMLRETYGDRVTRDLLRSRLEDAQ